ncbi:class I SAM-dependent DNA methyltransferase [Leptolyngbya sp. 7M]|uniref:class I SAM-dependent DNA methyltransferase n=1 Tax=Leptolyngbya sp. 7M TaxID=2812896 RepID=UPI001B8C9894|nr:class I SAM-dependent methyltransferase [Leptolyngbya sp. 7M]QYO62007.1 class I SAM-dependent methyltransferase [Leptolyngbya sp. 7M]
MNVFHEYARYYDLLYRDKDYSGETQFIHQLIQAHAPHAKSLLDLGCGTGAHATLLAKAGYQVRGVDLSQEMLQKANERRLQLASVLSSKLCFSQGDIRQIRLNQTFDVVLSLFHVISYQTTNADLLAAFQTVKEHLKPGGVFIFDVWYGPAVLSDRPTVRVKRLEDEETLVTRIAEPVMHPNENLVDVKYQIFIKQKYGNTVQELYETHRMRYLFQPEIELLLRCAALELIDCGEWMSKQTPGFNSWGVYFIARGGGR